MSLHSDNPELIDSLTRDEFVKQIVDYATKSPPPLVLGLHGDWGSGKTSVLNQIELAITDDCTSQNDDDVTRAKQKKKLSIDKSDHVKTVWFEAWRYQNEPVPIVALLHEIRAQLSKSQKLLGSAKKLGEVAIRGALLSLEDLTKKIGFQASKVEQAGKDWEQTHFASILPANAIREQLEAAVKQLLPDENKKNGKPKPRAVIFIDDLDRCSGEAAFRLLEGLKLYLTLNNCVFILGMNQQIVEDAIAQQMKVTDETERKQRAGAYLEKICQNIWRMPPVADPKTYLLDLLPDPAFRQSVDSAIGNAKCLPPNPRRLKALANLLIRNQILHSEPRTSSPKLDDTEVTRLILIVCLFHQFHHDLFRHWQVHPELWDKLWKWCLFETPYHSETSMLPVPTTNPAPNTPDIPRDLVYDLLRPLKRVRILRTNRNTSVPTRDNENAFTDPADTNVCWAQPLVYLLSEELKNRNMSTLSAEIIHQYVRGMR